ncbi:hypothetical protein ACFHYJ_05310 [Pasteurella multocida]|uniref:hypothetical protein n=1 Tax=Pasteurella multocida TaxID=747 RepID=UPI000E04F749|nr:hypothetical protein [Pasteurella multocida]SUB42745.1 Uncharacterised protein [Pasteurella multocida subsp. septica]HDR1578637.1 hypothetical protein [Pasteurella multocida]HEA3306782.1 hypothetical protein [Pasteurella multocida]
MNDKVKFNIDSITPEQLRRYLIAKNIIKGDSSFKCLLCDSISHTYFDTFNLLPDLIQDDDSFNVKCGISLRPNLIEPRLWYMEEFKKYKKEQEEKGKHAFPIDVTLNSDLALETLLSPYFIDVILLQCDNCGHTIFIERKKIIEFLGAEG